MSFRSFCIIGGKYILIYKMFLLQILSKDPSTVKPMWLLTIFCIKDAHSDVRNDGYVGWIGLCLELMSVTLLRRKVREGNVDIKQSSSTEFGPLLPDFVAEFERHLGSVLLV